MAAEIKTSVTRKIISNVESQETIFVFDIFEQVGLTMWLTKHPLNLIEFSKKLFLEDGKEANGIYSYKHQKAEIATFRTKDEYNQPLEWGKVGSLSSTASTILQAVQFTLLHEIGHHVHKILRDTDMVRFGMTMRTVATNGASNYAKKAQIEYFAETFVAWVVYRTELAVHDEVGYAMIQQALKAVGLEVSEYDFSD